MFMFQHIGVLAYAAGFTLWVYKHSGPIADVTAPGFFEPAADTLAIGDMLMVVGADGNKIVAVRSTAPVEVVGLA